MAANGEGSNTGISSTWTWEQNKAFEIGLAIYPENSPDRWEKIAADIPGNKTLEEIQHHYQLLVDDINLIESGRFPLPCYTSLPTGNKPSSQKGNGKESEWETRKGQPWTEEEHNQFLLGMDKYGKGDWKSISKEFVKTRTPTQVASHAQKHFKRQNKTKDTRRSSIFDITNPNNDRQEGDNDGNASKDKGTTSAIVEGENKEEVKGENKEEVAIGEGIQVFDSLDSLPLSPPDSWCLEDDLVLELDETLSQLPPL